MLTAVDFSPPENARFCISPSRIVHFKKSVKYKSSPWINYERAHPALHERRSCEKYLSEIKELYVKALARRFRAS
jgi:hypothetical protein